MFSDIFEKAGAHIWDLKALGAKKELVEELENLLFGNHKWKYKNSDHHCFSENL